MIYCRRLCQPFFLCYWGVLLLAGIACSLYGVTSHLACHEAYVFISVISVTAVTAVLWVVITGLALVFSSTFLYLLSGIFCYINCAALLLLMIAGLANRAKCELSALCFILRIATAVVVVVSWAYNVVIVNWAMKLRRELEHERNLLKAPSYIVRVEARGMRDVLEHS